MRHTTLLLAGVVTAGLAGCSGSSAGPGGAGTTTTAGPVPTKTASIDAAGFVSTVDNPWFPLPPGARWVYHGTENGRATSDVVVVTDRRKTIAGVDCVVVRDDVYTEGQLSEHTFDYYAQSTTGAVWYFGEDTEELDADGNVKNREGSWQTGVDGASPGMIMPASPRVGMSYAQEHYAGHAEDHARVIAVNAPIRTPAAASQSAVVTTEWTPLEPNIREHKYYIRGIGQVKEDVFQGGQETSSLTSYHGLG